MGGGGGGSRYGREGGGEASGREGPEGREVPVRQEKLPGLER